MFQVWQGLPLPSWSSVTTDAVQWLQIYGLSRPYICTYCTVSVAAVKTNLEVAVPATLGTYEGHSWYIS